MSIDDIDSPFPPLSSRVQVEFGAHSQRGRRRPVNTDHYVVVNLSRHQETVLTSLPDTAIARRFDEQGFAMVVADGLGLPGAAEAASRLALATLIELTRHFGKWNLRVDDRVAREIVARAERFYRNVDATVAYKSVMGRVPNLQTTLTATFGAGRDLFFAHVGHSRAYLFRSNQLMRLTRDHTIGMGHRPHVGVAPLVDVNIAARDLKHILTETIGMGGLTGPTIDLERVQIDDRDVVLVCTNGLTDALDEQMIADVLALDEPPSALSATLVDLAMEADGQDDVTALVGRYHFHAAAE